MTHVAATEPYAWPYDGRLAGGHLALVLSGWDEGWCSRSIAPEPVLRRCTDLARAVAAAGGVVATVAQGGVALPSPAPGPAVVTPAIDGLHASPLDDTLRALGRTHLLVAGFGLEGPVHSTLRSANDRGYECLLVVDACAALTDELAPASAKTVTMSGGIFGAVGTTEHVLAALAPLATPAP